MKCIFKFKLTTTLCHFQQFTEIKMSKIMTENFERFFFISKDVKGLQIRIRSGNAQIMKLWGTFIVFNYQTFPNEKIHKILFFSRKTLTSQTTNFKLFIGYTRRCIKSHQMITLNKICQKSKHTIKIKNDFLTGKNNKPQQLS